MTITARPIKTVMLVAPQSTGGNFEYVAIPRQGPLYISGALKQWEGEFHYEREVWYEDRNGLIDPAKDLTDTDLLLITALINEAPRAYEISRSARIARPNLKIIGGGPHMGPLCEEALRYGMLDVVVQREGEDIIGQLCDVILKFRGQDLTSKLHKIPGIAFLDGDDLVQTGRRGVIRSDFVELPDFASMKDLTPQNPLAAGVIETVRGCTENCTYCQVIQQFLGYRMVARDVEIKRLAQLQQLAEDGLIFAARDGRFSVFVSDDLHPPPLRAVKFRDERLARLHSWQGHTENMWMICQTRAEIGQDPELAGAMLNAGLRMLYVGVESSSAENLKAVNKRQDPSQMHKDLTTLNDMGFIVAAMTIIGLPYDTEESIMQMADWARTVSRYQTANLLTPLPSTINWDTLRPLAADGSLLAKGEMRPYHLYTGKQLVHHDERWGMKESRDLYSRYTAKLRPVDKMYERIFRIFKSKAFYGVMENRLDEATQRPTIATVRSDITLARDPVAKLQESLTETVKLTREALLFNLSELVFAFSSWPSHTNPPKSTRQAEPQSSLAVKVADLQEKVSASMDELGNTVSERLNDIASQVANNTEEIRSSIAAKLDELSSTVQKHVNDIQRTTTIRLSDLRGTVVIRADEMGESVTVKIAELADAIHSKINDLNLNVSRGVNEYKKSLTLDMAK